MKEKLLALLQTKFTVLLTAHRRENLGEPMYHIFRAIKRLVDEFDDVKVVYPSFGFFLFYFVIPGLTRNPGG